VIVSTPICTAHIVHYPKRGTDPSNFIIDLRASLMASIICLFGQCFPRLFNELDSRALLIRLFWVRSYRLHVGFVSNRFDLPSLIDDHLLSEHNYDTLQTNNLIGAR
jgi:hypothetical protein